MIRPLWLDITRSGAIWNYAKRSIRNRVFLFRIALFFLRWTRALRLWLGYGWLLIRWLVLSKEHTNYTYHLTGLNVRNLEHFISVSLGTNHQRVGEYMDEILRDTELSKYVSDRVLASKHRFEADLEARYGRRIGWYAIVRILKPRVVVETGTDKGLGSCVLACALLRNDREGFPGKLYTIDVDSTAGWLVAEPYERVVELIFNDSHSVLKDFGQPIDLFIHDSFHDYAHESKEYALIGSKLADGAVVISDNAHAGSALMDFSENNAFDFYFWSERPDEHFYPGGGIGLAVRQKRCN